MTMWLTYIILSVAMSVMAFRIGYHNGAKDMVEFLNEQEAREDGDTEI